MVVGTLDLGNGSYVHKCFYDEKRYCNAKIKQVPYSHHDFWRKSAWHILIQSTTGPIKSLFLVINYATTNKILLSFVVLFFYNLGIYFILGCVKLCAIHIDINAFRNKLSVTFL